MPRLFLLWSLAYLRRVDRKSDLASATFAGGAVATTVAFVAFIGIAATVAPAVVYDHRKYNQCQYNC